MSEESLSEQKTTAETHNAIVKELNDTIMLDAAQEVQ